MRATPKPRTDGQPPGASRKAARTNKERMGSTFPGVCRCGATLKKLKLLVGRVCRLERAIEARGDSVVTLGHLAGRADDILDRVCRVLNVPLRHLQHGGRTRALSEARWLAAAALAAHGIPHSGIAIALRWTTPSNVSHALKSHTARLAQPDYARAWAKISAK